VYLKEFGTVHCASLVILRMKELIISILLGIAVLFVGTGGKISQVLPFLLALT
jgi:hypothetical protein